MSIASASQPHVIVEEVQSQLATVAANIDSARFYLGLAAENTWESTAGRLYVEWLVEQMRLIETLRDEIASLRHTASNF